ncbi:staygreen family protein [Cytobacillus purgationiresistens]|uniref:Staygreen protein domain-containing protein n=1 Tax=Cytobacillus purgationiresistens TaxID=863449 RepID=A0ABU0ACR7_9BACI|nr:staygreen family protein [Cytobacillus purgationiresistens]MDQ0268597.1 hypothetical protein [Cytobacillus purgationiresistens]
MNTFDQSNLKINFQAPATDFTPVEHRKYTLTQSDSSNDIFLTIGHNYDYEAIKPTQRDELLAEWIPQMGQYVLLGKVHISNGEFDEHFAKIRYMIYEREADLGLTAILFGDREFLSNYPWLLNSPIYVQFHSNYPEFNKLQYYGTARQFLNKSMHSANP